MLKNFKIGSKLFICFAVILAGLIAVSVFGIISLRSISSADSQMYEQNLMGLSVIANVDDAYYSLRVTTLKTVYENFTSQGADALETELSAAKTEIDKQIADYQTTVINKEDQTNVNNLKQFTSDYETEVGNIVSLVKLGDKTSATSQMTTVGATATKAGNLIDTMIKWNEEQGNVKKDSNNAMGNSSIMIMIIIAAAMIGLAVLLAVLLTRGITKPMKKIIEASEKLAVGDLEVNMDIKSKDEVGHLAITIDKVIIAVKMLISDANMLSEAAIRGEFETRADAGKHYGDYKKIVDGVNKTLDTVVDKVFWFESLLDSISSPISVTDMDMNWTFINKPVEQMLNVKRKEILGKQCNNWNANICNTENCGIARLKNGQLRTEFEQMGGAFQVDSSYILNLNGEKVGHIEVVQDITDKVRSSQYNKEEVRKLAENLQRLSEGRLQLEFAVADADQYTEQDKKNFEAINGSLKTAVDGIASYIGETKRVLAEMAIGNMQEEIHGEFAGDFVEIKNSINAIIVSLNTMLTEITRSSAQVAAGTKQVSDGSQTLAQGASEQASSIEELTSSIIQVAAQTKQNATNASEANELAVAAKGSASKGNDQMQDMLKSMDEINESSSNISKIIKVIDDIAFQTNILALNAAVEAARAGMHGKGFAVVAEEVRSLAAKSADAAKETTNMIEGSIKKVEQGTKLANGTAEALGEIVGNVEKAATLVAEIAIASNQQSAAIGQINKGIEQVSAVVQSNSATAEESAAASEELSGQAEILKGLAAEFRLRDFIREESHSEDKLVTAGSTNRNADKY